ncbi:MAG TPA: bifunctional adenosylcobinamide kinase/adenosylcobinamide-phosphate guanylyltransferase [Acidimicrobiia bacterium]|nr:bifunctional adenosylcobinamide kinase/adenosylcobinamide-phosphate guanylyltransferase [Acidimicrobiia bacterium]
MGIAITVSRAWSPVITLVLGGVRSGKSEVAERLAGPGPGTYLATGLVAPGDGDFAARVARHRARRPPAWSTVEEPRAVPAVLSRLHGPVLLDALGTWIANDIARADIDGLVAALVSRPGDTVVVSEEVGLGVHPVSEVGRQFADRLGEANRRIAEVADRCLLVVAGRVIDLPAGAPPGEPALGNRALGEPPVGEPPVGAPPVSNRAPGEPALGGPPTGLRAGSVAAAAGLRQAVAFLTPLGGPATPTPAALAWFPVVGATLGLALGGVWWAVGQRLGPLAAAALVVSADLVLTGALHFDGLLDSADGLLPHLPAGRRLAVMAEPDIGAFAVAAGGAALLLRTAALAAFGRSRPLLLAALWCWSRTAMAATARGLPYARPAGLASSFLDDDRPGLRRALPAALGGAAAAVLAALDAPRSVLAVIAAALAALGVAALAERRLGGFTGDTLGAAGVVAETTGLLVAVAVLRP